MVPTDGISTGDVDGASVGTDATGVVTGTTGAAGDELGLFPS